MNSFNFPRFRRLFVNDALRVTRVVGLMTAALLCLTCVVYIANLEPGHIPEEPTLGVVLFGIYLLGGGLLLTSEIFRDMHHPLERYHYLMLPVSNLERFLSRYLLTGPLLVLYLLVAFTLMDWSANMLAQWLKEASAPAFSVSQLPVRIILCVYLFTHVLGFLGAICFRSMNLLKTALTAVACVFSLGVAGYVAMRVFFFDSFDWGSFVARSPIHLSLIPVFEGHWANVAVVTGFATWLLYVAYRCLKAHEVQNGL